MTRFRSELTFDADKTRVFNALHHYKHDRDPNAFFLGPWLLTFVDMQFEILTENPVGLGATYAWAISVLGREILRFHEQIIEWKQDELVVYRAVSGWDMEFRTEVLERDAGSLLIVEINITFGHPLLDRILRPFVQFGLGKVCQKLVERGLRRELGLAS